MDCGIPFCHEGCPLGNLIPEWNDLVYKDDWSDAIERLHATNNFPEFTGRLCPAPCEAACVLGINDEPVTIERIEYEIVERAWSEGWVDPRAADHAAPASAVAVVGSGPAGLAAAQQLARAGHDVTVFERAEKPGGLLRYGIPEFKMEKAVLDRRLAQLEAEGVTFVCSTAVGRVRPGGRGTWPSRASSGAWARPAHRTSPCVRRPTCATQFDAVVLAGGATLPRDLPVPGRALDGVHLALDYLKPSNLVQEGALRASPISASGKAGRHHRWRRHRSRLPRHGAPSGRRLGAPVRDPARAAPPPGPTPTRGRCGRSSCGRRPPTKRAVSASSP